MLDGFGVPAFLPGKSYTSFDITQRAKRAELFRSQRGIF